MFHMEPKYGTFHIFMYFELFLKSLPSPVSCSSMECLNAQRCLLASPSHPPRPGTSFATMAALFTVSLAARRPYLPLPFSVRTLRLVFLPPSSWRRSHWGCSESEKKKRGLHACPWIKKHKNKKKRSAQAAMWRSNAGRLTGVLGQENELNHRSKIEKTAHH